jgi:uncharacterized protein
MVDLSAFESFEWDSGNARKNEKHGVSQSEAEQVFFNQPLLLLADLKQSGHELRFHALGRTDEDKPLHISFTVRENRIRVISARPMHRKERDIYEQTSQTSS